MKAIFVDNGSLEFMCRGLGLKRVDYGELFKILTSEIGEANLSFRKPLITIGENAKTQFVYVLRRIGFKVVFYTPGTGQDDQIIIDRIAEIDPNIITEIILVSADFDYVEVLSAMVGQKVSVYLVAARVKGARDGKEMLGQRYDHFLGKVFHFVDLAQYKERLIFHGHRTRQPPPSGGGNEKEHG